MLSVSEICWSKKYREEKLPITKNHWQTFFCKIYNSLQHILFASYTLFLISQIYIYLGPGKLQTVNHKLGMYRTQYEPPSGRKISSN